MLRGRCHPGVELHDARSDDGVANTVCLTSSEPILPQRGSHQRGESRREPGTLPVDGFWYRFVSDASLHPDPRLGVMVGGPCASLPIREGVR